MGDDYIKQQLNDIDGYYDRVDTLSHVDDIKEESYMTMEDSEIKRIEMETYSAAEEYDRVLRKKEERLEKEKKRQEKIQSNTEIYEKSLRALRDKRQQVQKYTV